MGRRSRWLRSARSGPVVTAGGGPRLEPPESWGAAMEAWVGTGELAALMTSRPPTTSDQGQDQGGEQHRDHVARPRSRRAQWAEG